MNLLFFGIIIFIFVFFLLSWFTKASSKKMAKGVRALVFLLSIILAILFVIAGRFLFSLPLLLLAMSVLKIKGLRTYGTAEINIIDIVKPITKFSAVINSPSETRYLLEKAFYLATSGRPGPVWLDIPLDVQKAKINFSKLKKFKSTEKKIFIR